MTEPDEVERPGMEARPDVERPMMMDGERVVYWLDHSSPDPSNKPGEQPRYRVCLVKANEAGYYQMGNESKGQQPWYWDEETCRRENSAIGNTPMDVARIVGSSMGAQNRSRTRGGFRRITTR